VRRYAGIAMIASIVLIAGGCGGGGGSSGACGSSSGGQPSAVKGHQPVTLCLWTGFNEPEFGYLNNTIKAFERKYPWIHVNTVPGKDDTAVLNALHSGTAPDVASITTPDDGVEFCSTNSFVDLKSYIDKDHIDLRSLVPAGALAYTAFADPHSQCLLPMLSDAYGLVYNTALFNRAGISSPPKTYSELFADAKKLTQLNSDGSIKVAGFLPLATGDYELANVVNGVQEGAQWYDSTGKCLLGKDPRFASMLEFYKSMTDWFGFDKLNRFFASNGGENTEFSPSNLFERGKLAMAADGEWRGAFIRHDHAKVQGAAAPYPVPDSSPGRYGVGQTGGSVLGVPRSTPNPAAAWLLVKYLALDPQGERIFADQIGNVPTVFADLHDPVLTRDPNFRTYIHIFFNPLSRYKQITKLGFGDTSLYDRFVDTYLAGKVSDLRGGLDSVATQIDQQLRLGQ